MTWSATNVLKSGYDYPPYEIDIRQWTDITPWNGSSGTDIGPIIDEISTYLKANYLRGTIKLPPLGFYIDQPPTNLSGILLSGAQQQGTGIFFGNSSGTLFNITAAGGYTGGGLENFFVELLGGMGNSNAKAIVLNGDATYQPGSLTMKSLYITFAAGSLWDTLLSCDGSARTSPQGQRAAIFEDVQLFGSHNVGAYFKNAVAFSITNLGTYSGTGTGMDVHITGGGTSTTNTTQCSFRDLQCNGDLYVDNCLNIGFSGSVICNTAHLASSATFVSGTICANAQSGTIGTPNNLTVLT